LIAGDSDWREPSHEWFWVTAEEWEPGSTLTKRLSPAAHLLQASSHLMLKHGTARSQLLWFYDLYLLVHKDQLEWQEIPAKAQEFYWSAALQDALQNTNLMFGLPNGVLSVFKNEADLAARRLVESKGYYNQPRAINFWSFLTTVTWRARFVMAFAILFPSPEFLKYRYNPRPVWLWPFYYLYRWLDMFSSGVHTLSKKVCIFSLKKSADIEKLRHKRYPN
ncbi:MAG: hypothetical protein DRH24_08990, partial [Deltaproteobacteria bacterium]